MADSSTFLQLLEEQKLIDTLLELDQIDEDEKEELNYIWDALKSRQESKFDAIVSVIKECDSHISKLENEKKALESNCNYWKKKRDNVINIVKKAYERQLISSKPTGSRYQATIRAVKSKLISNFEKWDQVEKSKFGLYKRTTISRAIDNSILEQNQEEMPDKELLRRVLESNPKAAPDESKLVQRVSFTYGLRKRIKKGV
jgi:membrane-associated HD superfamily phosphohydrolase|tara:strand:- start:372 stop:974 length:603 start_codon:yes stop_codon:yes gene_type:complete